LKSKTNGGKNEKKCKKEIYSKDKKSISIVKFQAAFIATCLHDQSRAGGVLPQLYFGKGGRGSCPPDGDLRPSTKTLRMWGSAVCYTDPLWGFGRFI